MSQTTEIVTLPPPTVTPMTLLQTAIGNNIDPDKLGKLIELSEQWNRDRAAENFALAITNFQRDCPMIGKDREAKDKDKNTMYKFATFEDIWRKIRGLLTQNSIAVTFDTCPAESMLSVTCKVRVGIHVETSSLVLPIPPATARCNATQAMASATSYGKRYALCSALGIVTADEDDDARSVESAPITDEEMDYLGELLLERLDATGKKVNEERFAGIFGANRFAEIPRSRFKDACAQLRNDIANARKAGAK